MTQTEYNKLVAMLDCLKEVAVEYSGRSIDNIISNIEARIKHADEKGLDTGEVNEVPVGKTIEVKGHKLLCQKCDDGSCDDCFFQIEGCDGVVCCGSRRADKNDVVFIDITEGGPEL